MVFDVVYLITNQETIDGAGCAALLSMAVKERNECGTNRSPVMLIIDTVLPNDAGVKNGAKHLKSVLSLLYHRGVPLDKKGYIFDAEDIKNCDLFLYSVLGDIDIFITDLNTGNLNIMSSLAFLTNPRKFRRKINIYNIYTRVSDNLIKESPVYRKSENEICFITDKYSCCECKSGQVQDIRSSTWLLFALLMDMVSIDGEPIVTPYFEWQKDNKKYQNLIEVFAYEIMIASNASYTLNDEPDMDFAFPASYNIYFKTFGFDAICSLAMDDFDERENPLILLKVQALPGHDCYVESGLPAYKEVPAVTLFLPRNADPCNYKGIIFDKNTKKDFSCIKKMYQNRSVIISRNPVKYLKVGDNSYPMVILEASDEFLWTSVLQRCDCNLALIVDVPKMEIRFRAYKTKMHSFGIGSNLFNENTLTIKVNPEALRIIYDDCGVCCYDDLVLP